MKQRKAASAWNSGVLYDPTDSLLSIRVLAKLILYHHSQNIYHDIPNYNFKKESQLFPRFTWPAFNWLFF